MDRDLTAVHVLVVDDSPVVLEVLSRKLESHGTTVTTVSTAERALALAAARRLQPCRESRGFR
jgi:CheY-like chemotaxis protein